MYIVRGQVHEPTMQYFFRKLEEKNLSAEVVQMKWSPKMDLIALANIQGEVVLHRLQWQRVWLLPVPAEETSKIVTALAWRPDGKVLAVSYESGKVFLCDVENAAILHKMEMGLTVNCMQWINTDDKTNSSNGNVTDTNQDANHQDIFQDNSYTYLPKMAPLPKSYTTTNRGTGTDVHDIKRLQGQERLNVLVVGMASGRVQLYAFGIAPVGHVDLKEYDSTPKEMKSVMLSSDLHTLWLMMEQVNNATDESACQGILLSCNSTLLSSRRIEIAQLSAKYGKISSLMEYLNQTVKSMSEAWEDILLEMESKLNKYAESKPTPGTVCDDFLQLLMWGKSCQELQAFLLHELTEKGLKKLGHSVENSYCNIQKLILKNLQSVGQMLLFHLTELKGMSLWYDKYGVLGLSPASVQDAIIALGSFMLKANELLQVIDSSLTSFKAFFRWLYVIMMRLANETVPPAISKMNQKNVNFVADFLTENFTDNPENEGKTSGFTLERVGQYLKKEDLQLVTDVSRNDWYSFIQSSPIMQESPLLYPHQPTKSLIQLHEQLQTAINTALNRPSTIIGQHLQCNSMFKLYNSPKKEDAKRSWPVSQHCVGSSLIYIVMLPQQVPSDSLYIIRQPDQEERSSKIEFLKLCFGTLGDSSLNSSTTSTSPACSQHQVLDACFYDDETLSLLLHEMNSEGENLSILCQLSLSALIRTQLFIKLSSGDVDTMLQKDVVSVDAGIHVTQSRRLENMKAGRFAVSGSRKVSCVVFSNFRRVRIFDMETEDDNEDESSDASVLDTTKEINEEENKENISLTG
ncbi:anaphase-promoting complex subunit 4-like isoform X3 [Anneissia japonica]|uniref:anaphase-promoting complex subunit 4-like isoform X3 n=1 Tax=Anneissia japonica TaxID=1529436 RepID=UPI0014257D9E|nr:anaphase-promoting complex subunit 4-like isoform X3 [Anneissia japonica]